MRHRILALLIIPVLFGTFTRPARAIEPPSRVILIILDGTRRQEAFYPKPGQDPFPLLRSRIQRGDLLSFGDPKRNERMAVINSYALSLPGYQSILSGRDSGKRCIDNTEKNCPLQPNETFLDTFAKNPEFEAKDVLSLASWYGLDRAVSVNRSPAFFHNSSFMPVGSPDAVQNQKERSYFSDLDRRIQSDRPIWENSRKDKYTREYFEKLENALTPRLSVVQLVDSDEWGHENNFWEYYRTLREDDEWIDGLIRRSDEREAAGLSGPTHFLITTDHGRGEGRSLLDVFRNHGKWQPSSYDVWAFLRLSPSQKSRLKKSVKPHYSHANIRPTIEYLLGEKANCTSDCFIE